MLGVNGKISHDISYAETMTLRRPKLKLKSYLINKFLNREKC